MNKDIAILFLNDIEWDINYLERNYVFFRYLNN